MKTKNVIAESHSYEYCKKIAESNQEVTGNPSYVDHLGPQTNDTDRNPYNYQTYIAYEIITID